MKTIVTMISSLIMGALMANSNFSPLQELGHLLMNKRRFIYALGLYSAGFVFLMAGIITGAVEATLQYEAQGFVFWSAMGTLAFSFAAVGVAFIIGGRLTLPTFMPQVANLSSFAPNLDWKELLEGALKIFGDLSQGSREAEPPPTSAYQPASAAAAAPSSAQHHAPVPPTASASHRFSAESEMAH